jgi:threonine dehydratase
VIPFEWLESAQKRINGIVKRTPLIFDASLGVFIKWENEQVTGSFKLRGAANKILSLQDWEKENGIITCSAGNHGQGCALVCQKANISCEVFASSHAVPMKIAAMERLGAKVNLVDGDYFTAERTAIRQTELTGKTFVSPYNDVQVIAGQGTLGLEISEQTEHWEKIKSVVVPVGGGGLISGIGVSLEQAAIKPKLIGVQSEASAYMHSIFYTGTQKGVKETESLADGLSGEVDHQSVTIPLVDKYTDQILLVSENDIEDAIRYAWQKHHQIIEGSGAVSLAAVLKGLVKDLPAVVIITGGNIQPEIHKKIVEKH